MTRRSGAGKAEPGRSGPTLSPEAQTLVDRARGHGHQGELAIQDFHRGNPVLGTHTYRQRLEQLQLDLMDFEMGRKVFGTPRDFGEVPEWSALLAKLKRAIRAQA